MAFAVTWSPEAFQDLELIAEYIGRDSEFYARSVVSKIVGLARDIKEVPWLGRVVPELGDEKIRERFVYSYRVVYQVQETRIVIVAVIHGKRLIDTILGRFGTSP